MPYLNHNLSGKGWDDTSLFYMPGYGGKWLQVRQEGLACRKISQVYPVEMIWNYIKCRKTEWGS